MADNPHVNKVDLADGSTLIDLTGDTATEADVVRGKTFHLASGATGTGSMDVAGSITDSEVDSVLADNAPTGTASLRLSQLSRFFTGLKNKFTNTKVKGDTESTYRTGDVNITPANIGAVNVSGDTMTGNLILPALKTSGGRVQSSGDDEGIVITPASNKWAGVCLGNPSGRRSVFYFNNDTSSVPRWRYNNGSSSYDILHPGKAGTIELTGHTHNYMPKTTVLYNNSSGTTGTVSLSASAANYNHMRIYFKGGTGVSSVDVYSPNGRTAELVGYSWISSNTFETEGQARAISGTSITSSANARAHVNTSGYCMAASATNISVVRVEAWNE